MPRLLLLLCWAAPLAAQQSAGPVSRRDLADAYLAIDGLVMTRPLAETRAAAINIQFDRSTLAFFGGNYGKVLRDMHGLFAEIAGDTAAAAPTRRLLALRVRAERRSLAPGDSVRAVLTLMYADSTWRSLFGARVALWRDGKRAAVVPTEVPANAAAGWETRLAFAPQTLGRGRAPVRLTLALEPADGIVTAARPTADAFVLAQPADSVRAALLRRLDALGPLSGATLQQAASARARAGLLVNEPAADNSAQFLADLATLSTQVPIEVSSIEAGLQRAANPYAGRTGDSWRVARAANGDVPYRLFIPKGITGPLPVVLALHGAGADENMFFDGYGAGILLKLAAQRGFVVISPVSSALGRDMSVFDSLLAVTARETPIDTSRVFVLGHSMGAGIAGQVAMQRASRVRAVAMIAGGGAITSANTPPLLFIGAEVDQVIPEPRVRQAYDRAIAAGARAEYRKVERYGHTLTVGKELPAVIEWLFSAR